MTRSVRIHAFGDADVLRIEDIVTGKPGAGEVRLRVHAIGLNRAEVTLRSGRSPVKPSSGSERTWARFSPQIMRGIMRAVGAILRSPNMDGRF
jgi:hypothetical protein